MIIRKKEEEIRKKVIEKFEEKNPNFKIARVKMGGSHILVVIKKEDFNLIEENPSEKPLRTVIAQGSKPGTEQIILVKWTPKNKEHSKDEDKRFDVDGSIININDAGEAVGKPGIMFPKKKKQVIEQ